MSTFQTWAQREYSSVTRPFLACEGAGTQTIPTQLDDSDLTLAVIIGYINVLLSRYARIQEVHNMFGHNLIASLKAHDVIVWLLIKSALS